MPDANLTLFSSAYACLQWACSSIGAILVTLNPAYRLKELVISIPMRYFLPNLTGVLNRSQGLYFNLVRSRASLRGSPCADF